MIYCHMKMLAKRKTYAKYERQDLYSKHKVNTAESTTDVMMHGRQPDEQQYAPDSGTQTIIKRSLK